MPLVIEFVKGRTVRVVVFQVQVMHLRFRGCMSTILTYIHLKINKINFLGCRKIPKYFFRVSKKSKIKFRVCGIACKVFVLPLTSSACNHTGEPHRELWGNGTPKNNVEWMTSHRDCTCRVEHLKKEHKWLIIKCQNQSLAWKKP